jgi:hypothetical protein
MRTPLAEISGPMDQMEGTASVYAGSVTPNLIADKGDDEKITMAEARKEPQNILNNDKVFIVSRYVTLVFPIVCRRKTTCPIRTQTP